MQPHTGVTLLEANEHALGMIEAREPVRDVLTHLTTTVEALSGGSMAASILVRDRAGLPGNDGAPNLPPGFAGAWSQPIKAADGRVLGTFGTYFREKRGPTPRERSAMGLLAFTAALAIDARA